MTSSPPGRRRPLLPSRLLPAVAVALAACGGTEAATDPVAASPPPAGLDAEDFERFRSEELGFEIDHPVDWTVEAAPGEGIVAFRSPPDEAGLSTNFNVAVGEVPASISPAVYYAGEVSRLETELAGVRILEQADVRVGEVTGRGVTLVADHGGVEVGISRLIVLHEGTAWEVSFFTPAARLEEMSPLAQHVLQSFRLLA